MSSPFDLYYYDQFTGAQKQLTAEGKWQGGGGGCLLPALRAVLWRVFSLHAFHAMTLCNAHP